MPRLTVDELKPACNWVSAINVDSSDPRWLIYLNECLEAFVNCALWDRVTQRYQICVNQSCITWPRPFIGIQVADVCRRPFQLRNHWFEFLEGGPGKASLKDCSQFNVLDRGRGYTMFDDLTTASKIRLYPQFAQDLGKKVTIRGYDSSGNYVLTNAGSTQGEVLTLAAPYVESATIWMRQVFREVIKDETLGYVRAYSWDVTLPAPPANPGPNDTPLKPMAIWEPDEKLPDYRRSFIPWLSSSGSLNNCGCNDNSSSCDKTTVTVIAKLQHIPVKNGSDFLPISNIGALKLGMMSIVLRERQDFAGADRAWFGTWDPIRKKYLGGALGLLEDELDSFQGTGTVVPIRLESQTIDRATLENLI